MILPASIKRVIDELAKLPSIGPRQATRLAFHLVSLGSTRISGLGTSIQGLAALKLCERCFLIHDNVGTLCSICSDASRNQAIIMVLEKETDLLSIENTKKYTGRYLIIGPIGKIGLLEEWQKVRLASLKNFIETTLKGADGALGKAKEIILAFNPTTLGDMNATSIARELQPLTEHMSRLGRGLPTGGEIEFADDETLGSAVERRS